MKVTGAQHLPACFRQLPSTRKCHLPDSPSKFSRFHIRSIRDTEVYPQKVEISKITTQSFYMLGSALHIQLPIL
ncbi:uncharacterized protein LACBIDRAFT_300212 [Laccaria bicolor S238N-H82]|uniref:Predicted protein n=1 Tax=Laccaria bicolor (strain S238N-H82 / ATCC MYA-4686) TaxID=486041 RepID=B0E3U1_LACBS|nr:uncharacterized protein LACBIDRAFT_300212 [Laccaria bicolor S238N-H82]EDQ98488.1 predicted protein [Laccaria bicolor S238N-H82]|eukprot:XP_001890861.1 predicted protein [Laccaria bicolor S238N-H82]